MISNQDNLSANKRALLKIRELKLQLEEQQNGSEPIAVVSMACRFPRTAHTPEKFWEQLLAKESFVSDIPSSRWDLQAFIDEDPDAPGRMYTQKGVYLESIDQMDPEFFGISPREAVWVDPQQRLLLEVAWEAIERAGWLPEKIGDSTGVFIGWMHNDYQNEASDSFLNLNPYIATGAAGSFLSGRLAYYLGLNGPALAVDTACSSSLVALHLALLSLQKKECDQAVVGGVNVVCSPTTNILTCKLKALSPSGHSRAFDATADGYLRGEGCGVITLKRLSDAEADGDSIIGVIKGSAIGHNGFSSRLTAPNPKAQETVIKQAMERAGITATDVSYLEAHGTGTELGDPLEVQAAMAAYCRDRSEENPLLIGSVKTNIGHLEAAAGMAGLIKVLMSLEHDLIPGQLHFETPNPHIPWDTAPIEVLKDATAWPDAQKKMAGVSAFGMSGTNAHVIVEGYQPAAKADSQTEPAAEHSTWPRLITISGHSEEALFANIESAQTIFKNASAEDLEKLASASNVGRRHHDYRAAIVAQDVASATESLRQLGRSQSSDLSITGVRNKKLKTAWHFTGQGSQYVSMARGLYDAEPVFRDCIEKCDSVLQDVRQESLKHILFAHPDLIHDTFWTQPGLFAIQMGLAHLFDHWGIHPDYVFGHSVGQFAAACVAGAMSWDDGLRLIAERGRLISSLPRDGKMLAIFANAATVAELVEGVAGVEVGAHNVSHIVVSGESAGVDEVAERCSGRKIAAKILKTSHAFHSPLMDPILEEFASFADAIEFKPCHTPLICNVTGKMLEPSFQFDGKYWAKHIRAAVQYQAGLETALDLGCKLFVELGPKPVLTGMAKSLVSPGKQTLLHCLDDKSNNLESMIKVLGALHVQGAEVDFANVYGSDIQRVGRRMANRLPTYQFQRRRFWGPDKPRADHAEHHTAHPLLGNALSLADDSSTTRFQNFVDQDSPSWMSDHEVMESVVMPGAGFVEMAIAAVQGKLQTFELSNIRFERPLNLIGRTEVQTVLKSSSTDDSQVMNLESHAKSPGNENWSKHFSAEQIKSIEAPSDYPKLEELKQRIQEPTDVSELYEFLASIDLTYGSQFQTIDSLWTSDEEILVKLVDESVPFGYHVSPTLLDGALHSLAIGLSREGNEMFLPVGIKQLRYYAPVEQEVWSHAKWLVNEGPTRTANLSLYSPSGELLVEIEELTVQRIDRSSMRRLKPSAGDPLVHTMRWQKSRLPGERLNAKKWLIVGSSATAMSQQQQIKSELESRQHHCQLVTIQSQPSGSSAADVAILDLQDSNAWRTLEADIREFANPEDIDGIVWVLSSEQEWDLNSPATRENCEGLISFVQRWRSTGRRQLSAGLQLVTEKAIGDSDQIAVAPDQTQYWGLGRVMAAECPEYRCRLIDVQSIGSDLDSLMDVILTESEEGQMVIRADDVLVPRIVRPQLEKTDSDSFEVSEQSSFLITGGLGKLGRQAALWLAQNGANEVVLVSRREPDQETLEFLQQIEELNCRPIVHQADLTLEADVPSLFEKFGNDYLPLKGIIHSAGVLDDGLIENQTWEKFDKVMSPKTRAAWQLHQHSLGIELDFFILYSSVASTLGSPGQSNYATGNAFLDGLSDHRRHLGLPALTINWGPWSEGMADDERVKRRLEVQGITALEVGSAHAAMTRSLQQLPSSHAIIIDVDWRKLKLGADGKTPRLLSELVTTRQKSRGGDSQLVAKLRKLAPDEQLRQVISTVQGLFQEVLASDAPPETDRPLIEMGLDSLMAVEFGSSLQMAFGDQFELGPSLLFDHPTIDSIGEYLCSLLSTDSKDGTAGEKSTQSDDAAEFSQVAAQVKEDIAIIGLSCRFPGANHYEEYWHNLMNKVDSVGEIPADRWDIDRFYSDQKESGKMHTRQGGFLQDIDQFDAGFFNISDNEACWIDPQHRLLLENCYHALEDAGIPTKPIPETNVGVFMGIMGQDYAFLPSLEDKEIIEQFEGAGLSHSAGVGRISYILGLEGPSVSIDTASSSSLVAIIQAMRSLQDRHCNLALAGGVNAILAPVNFLLMSKAGLLAPDGRCKSFSDEADGFGRGEGCGVVALKRLSDAEKDGDSILAVIRGGAIAHNGFTGGLTTPSSKAQIRVIESAVADAGISPNDVQYLEAHGTGTEFGDPIELSAAVKVYGKGRKRDNPLVVGSAKANIGHLEAAGGVSGLIKAVLAVHRQVIPPQNHFESPSRHIPWKRMPVEVPTEPKEFRAEERFAAVTALGLAGTNAHVVISNHVPKQPADETTVNESDPANSEQPNSSVQPSRKQALFVSAQSEKSLTELLQRLQNSLKDCTSFTSLAHASGVSRRHLPIRECIVADHPDEAIAQIELLLEKRKESDFHVSSNGKPNSSSGASINNFVWYFDGCRQVDSDYLDTLGDLSCHVRKLIENFDSILQQQASTDLKSYLSEAANQQSRLARFIGYATLASLFQQWGIDPDGITGQAEGQWAAACVAGVMSWEDAFSMATYCEVNLGSDWLADDSAKLDAFEKHADQFNFYPPHIRLICAISGEEIPVHRSLGGSYWRELLEAKNSARTFQSLIDTGPDLTLAFGKMLASATESLENMGKTGSLIFCETEGADLAENLYSVVSYLYNHGMDLAYDTVNGQGPFPRVKLPNYPFDRKRHWITDVASHSPSSSG